mmetsp:Transcript_15082/g.13627  ORF Transcript_15082/g.13627 Transcript_15082/m.13627 type:complete len:830 (+) Transcript_15082:96-2585(+)
MMIISHVKSFLNNNRRWKSLQMKNIRYSMNNDDSTSMTSAEYNVTLEMLKYFENNLNQYKIRNVYLNTKNVDINMLNVSPDISFWSNNFNVKIDDIEDSAIIATNSLALPLLNFNFVKAVEKVQLTINTPAKSHRSKSLLAIVRGVGSGKTRSLEEIRLYYQLVRGDCLAIPITFNSITAFEKSKETQPFRKQNHELDPDYSMVLAVAIRMLFMFYKIEYEIAMKIIYNYFRSKLDSNVEIALYFKYLLQSIVANMKSSLKQRSKEINSFILLIDESAKPSDCFSIEDVYSLVRQSIYSISFEKFTACKSAIIMTSLKNTNFFETVSNRPIGIIELTESLDNEKVVDEIWIPTLQSIPGYTIEKEIVKQDRDRLLLLASVARTAPRIVEIINDLLSIHLSSSTTPVKHLDNNVMSKIFNSMTENVNVRYPDSIFPKGLYLYALVFGDPISVDGTVLELVECSAYINQLTEFSNNPFKIIPQGNYVFLNVALEMTSESTIQRRSIEDELREVFKLLSNYIITGYGKPSGDLLESILMKWIRIRLLCSRLQYQNNDDEITYSSLQELFGLTEKSILTKHPKRTQINPYKRQDPSDLDLLRNNDVNADYLMELYTSKFPVNKLVRQPNVISSVYSISSWKIDIKNVNAESVAILKPYSENKSTNEHYDLGLFVPFNNNYHLVVIDSKSVDEIPLVVKSSSTILRKKDKPLYYQYFDLCNLQNEISEEEVRDLNSTNYLRAMYEGKWLYIYQTSYNGPNIFLQRDDFIDEIGLNDTDVYHKKKPNLRYGSVLIINRETTLNYLGFISDAYRVVRNYQNKYQVKEEKADGTEIS